MSDPDLSPLPNDLATLFASAARAETPDRALIARIQEGVLERLALRDLGDHGAPRGDRSAGPPHGHARTSAVVSKAAAAKLAAALALGGLAIGGGAGYFAGAHGSSPSPPASVVIVAPTVSIPPVDPAPSAAAPSPTVSSPPVVALDALPTASTAAVVARGDLRRERELIDAAGASLRAGHPDQALAEVDRHAERFPRGQLAEEREVLAVRALVALGRTADARARVDRARKQFPALARALEAALGTPTEK